MAETKGGSGSRQRRQTSGGAANSNPAASPGSTGNSSGSTTGDPLDLERDHFVAGDDPAPAAPPPSDDEYVPLAPELIEWTPERASAIVRAGGYLLHTADPIGSEPGGEELWRATEADIDAIAPPLARIANRYAPARALAGMSDEAELAIGVIGYARANLAERGRLVRAKTEREEQVEAPGTESPWKPEAPPGV